MNRLISALLKDEERSRTILASVAAIARVLAMALAPRCGFHDAICIGSRHPQPNLPLNLSTGANDDYAG